MTGGNFTSAIALAEAKLARIIWIEEEKEVLSWVHLGHKKVSPNLKILTVSYKDIPILVMPKLKRFVPAEVAFKLILLVAFLVKVCIKFRIVTYTKYVYHSGNQEAFVFWGIYPFDSFQRLDKRA